MTTAALRRKPNVVCQFALIFVITPGMQLDQKMPEWPYDMALAMNRSLPAPYEPSKIAASVVGMDVSQPLNQDAAEPFILFDWAQLSRQVGAPLDAQVSGALYYRVFERIQKLRAQGIQPIDIHFIGHSRGCYVNAQVLRLMAANRINRYVRMVRMTTLDPHRLPQFPKGDGVLEANPGGIVDWQENFFQMQGADVTGEAIPNAFNVDLTDIVSSWAGREKVAADHSEVHDWYHWMIDQRDTDADDPAWRYTDPAILKQQRVLAAERKAKQLKTRQLLYGRRPLVQTFAEGEPSFLDFFGARGNMPRPAQGVLQLTGLDEHVAGTAFVKEAINGDFAAECTFIMKGRNEFAPADGFTIAVLDAAQNKVGDTGGQLGYAGLSGFCVAFDTYSNADHGDPREPWMQVSLRVNGSPKWVPCVRGALPEPSNSGNPFRVRVQFVEGAMHVRVYSLGADKTTEFAGRFPPGFVIPHQKLVGFTASTGAGAQYHLIDDVMIIPRQ